MPLLTKVLDRAPEFCEAPILALLLGKQASLPPSLQPLDALTGGALARVLASGDFAGKRDETALLYPEGPARRVLLVGLGKGADVDPAAIRRAAAVAAKRARVLGASIAELHLPREARGLVRADEAAQAMAEGAHQGAWRYAALKQPKDDDKAPVEEVHLLAPGEADPMGPGHARGDAIGAGHVFARELQVLPGNVCTPAHLAAVATDLGARHGFRVTVLDRPAIEREGMGALLAVAQGSAQDPRFIVLEYDGAEGAPIVLVGKGITFDTGGISLKPAASMEDMKFDMSGAAAVLGTFEALGRLRPKVRVVGIVPSAENMPSGTAIKPGDVVRSMSGKTIEIINTDAEGRLILCDALAYARRFEPACVVDAATLTGAIVIGLGHTAAGVMGTDPAVVDALRQAGDRADERVWELPLWDEYRDLIKSDIADVKNSGGRPAGSITAGWFLKEFADGLAWAHLDIAGTAYSDRESPAMVKGPTGMGVRLFSEFVLARG